MSAVSFSERLNRDVENFTQVEPGKDIDHLIQEIASMNFEELPKDYQNDQIDRKRFKYIKNFLVVGSVVLAVAAVVAAIASIVISAGTLSGGVVTLAVVSGTVGVSAAFGQLNSAIKSFMVHREEERQSMNRINKLKNKVTVISQLIGKRMRAIVSTVDKEEWGNQILEQVEKINAFIRAIKERVPEKTPLFDEIDPSPLLAVK